MKIIGNVEPEINESSELVNTQYAGGTIVMLSRRETSTLALLQDAWDGKVFRFNFESIGNPKEKDMDNAFKSIYSFIEAKFAINELRNVVNNLDSILVKGENASEL
jgi:hypothetical protein